MPNPFNSEVGQQNKSSGKGVMSKGARPRPNSLRMKTTSWPGVPGKQTALRNPVMAKRIKTEAMAKGT